MKKAILLAVSLLALAGVAACTTDDLDADIITTMFPQYDFTRQIVGDEMTVRMLVPPGTEIHGFEASSRDIESVVNAKLFIYTSDEIDSWIAGASSIAQSDVMVLDLSEHVIDVPHDHDHDDHDHETHVSGNLVDDHDDHDHADDVHYWTDPLVAITMIETILDAVISIDPDNEALYTENAHAYIDSIMDAHVGFDTFIQSLVSPSELHFAGHNAMGMFASRYHLEIHALFDDFKPDADLTSAELLSFVETVKTAGVHHLFIEELAEPKAANAIQAELARQGYTLELLELHGYHNVTKDEFDQGVTYLDLFERNILNITSVLDPS
jgi:zinc transport system substrate-binding protein